MTDRKKDDRKGAAERSRLARAWELLRDPATPEKRRILAERWAELDPALRLPGQGLGQKATGCGATVGIKPRCDFACTGCYLGSEANRIPALPKEAIYRQLDELRRYLGPKSNVQITDGEVTLLPVEELTAILRYAKEIGVIPMVMTHGDQFRRKPGLLERLMVEGGLTEVSIHVDTTQRGRAGWKTPPATERELHPLRDELAEIVRQARKTTGLPLRAAATMTITRDNLPGVADVVRWTVANRDAVSLISFQPLAQVGRTQKELRGVTATELWTEVSRGVESYGVTLENAEPMHFGHPDCTRFVPLLALERPGEGEPRLFQMIRDRPADVAVVEGFFAHGLGGTAFRDDSTVEKVARGAGMVSRAPGWMLGPVRRWAAARVREEAGTTLGRLLWDAVRGRLRVDGLTLTSHHFMSPEELTTEAGKERLSACVFRLPVKGEMIPMCQMNAGGGRERLYAEIVTGAPEADSLKAAPKATQ
jgi:molybdenum cofactor biosynthesis enzyme MoaA